MTGRQYGFSALDQAAQNGQAKVLKHLLNQGVSVNAESDPDGGTPLTTASLRGHMACMQILLDAGANTNQPDQKGRTALYWTAKEGQLEAIELLLRAGAKVQSWRGYRNDPLCIASLLGHTASVRTLLVAGNPVTTSRQHGFSALHHAAKGGHAEILILLLQQRVCADAESQMASETPLMYACKEGHLSCIQILLDAGAKVNLPDDTGRTALYSAAQHGQTQAEDDNKTSPDGRAAQHGQTQALALLLEHGANVSGSFPHYAHPLCAAARTGQLACVQALVAAGSPTVIDKKQGPTALHYAAQQGHLQVLKYLLQKGALIDAENPTNGETPLMVASQGGHLTCIQALLAAGATLHPRDQNGKTALDHAAHKMHMQAVDLLLSHGRTLAG